MKPLRVPVVLSLLLISASACAQERPLPTDTSPEAATEQTEGQVAGSIFGVPVPMGNYRFARDVAHRYPRPGWAQLAPEEKEREIWEALILHYEAFQRDVAVSDDALEQRINAILRSRKQPFTRAGDPAAYASWVEETAGLSVELFTRQMEYLLQIDTLKSQIHDASAVTVTEDELHEEFLDEQHHVGGQIAVLDTKEAAQAFYERVRGDAAAWEAAEASGEYDLRPVGLMTLEAYIDLWNIPREQIYAFHALEINSIGRPMPFGTQQWCVYRLLEKRTADLKDFPPVRDRYERQVTLRKRRQALRRWIDELTASARLQVSPALTPPSE